MAFTEYNVDRENVFKEALRAAQEQCNDLTLPLTGIARHWFRSNRAIFALTGPGRYADLVSSTKRSKERNFGFTYPILLATGRLMASITDPPGTESINEIIGGKQLLLGTSVPYAIHHQYGTGKMPMRKPVFFGPEYVFRDDPTVSERPVVWAQMLQNYVVAKTKQAGVGR